SPTRPIQRSPLSLHDALPIFSDTLKILRSDISQPTGLTVLTCKLPADFAPTPGQFVVPVSYNSLLEGETATAEAAQATATEVLRSEEHTSELQSRFDLVCRLL